MSEAFDLPGLPDPRPNLKVSYPASCSWSRKIGPMRCRITALGVAAVHSLVLHQACAPPLHASLLTEAGYSK